MKFRHIQYMYIYIYILDSAQLDTYSVYVMHESIYLSIVLGCGKTQICLTLSLQVTSLHLLAYCRSLLRRCFLLSIVDSMMVSLGPAGLHAWRL